MRGCSSLLHGRRGCQPRITVQGDAGEGTADGAPVEHLTPALPLNSPRKVGTCLTLTTLKSASAVQPQMMMPAPRLACLYPQLWVYLDQMDFEWSEAKRIAVLEARGLDFIDAEILFDGRPLYTVASPRGFEERWLSVGELNGRLVAVVWTQRRDSLRIIMMRRARNEEKERYGALYG
jgi:uncharacterized protein